MRRNLMWVTIVAALAYVIGWGRGSTAGVTYTRDAWTRAVRRDQDG